MLAALPDTAALQEPVGMCQCRVVSTGGCCSQARHSFRQRSTPASTSGARTGGRSV